MKTGFLCVNPPCRIHRILFFYPFGPLKNRWQISRHHSFVSILFVYLHFIAFPTAIILPDKRGFWPQYSILFSSPSESPTYAKNLFKTHICVNIYTFDLLQLSHSFTLFHQKHIYIFILPLFSLISLWYRIFY